jgi:PEP-CTERM motif
VLHVKVVLFALIVAAFAASPAEATLFNFTITGTSGFSGSGTFTTSNTPDPNAEDPGGFLVTAMTGTFKGATIVRIEPVNTLSADNDYYTTGLHVDDDGWTWLAGGQDYNMFLSLGTDSHGNPTANLLIGFPGIPGGMSKKVTFTATAVGSASVPEPATLGLLGMGVIGLGLMRRRKAV